MRRLLLSLASTLALLVSGCAGSPSSADGITTTREVLVTVEASPVEVTLDTGGIDGVVVDDESAPVPGAKVALVGFANITNTDNTGRFTFSNLQPGEYRITV